jgi:RimJ/RimL family protein N-acetyltransferase
MTWMYQPTPVMQRELLQWQWRALAHWKAESWNLPLAIFANGEPIGGQDLFADDYPRVRAVGTGSWLTRGLQGNGYGTEARAAVLELAFGPLGALEANTVFVAGNHASERVSRKLGYVDTGRRPSTGTATGHYWHFP